MQLLVDLRVAIVAAYKHLQYGGCVRCAVHVSQTISSSCLSNFDENASLPMMLCLRSCPFAPHNWWDPSDDLQSCTVPSLSASLLFEDFSSRGSDLLRHR